MPLPLCMWPSGLCAGVGEDSIFVTVLEPMPESHAASMLWVSRAPQAAAHGERAARGAGCYARCCCFERSMRTHAFSCTTRPSCHGLCHAAAETPCVRMQVSAGGAVLCCDSHFVSNFG